MPKSKDQKIETGNFVSEWFGHRVYPVVSQSPDMLIDQNKSRCPFLSRATGEERECIKAAASKGVCTINSVGSGRRQDWLVCPYRLLDSSLLQDCIHRIYGISDEIKALILPAPTLQKEMIREELSNALSTNRPIFVFFQDKLGGEISISATERSPELSFDITFVEIVRENGKLDVGRYGILEVQTMDFHGTYRYAVKNLEDALRLHRSGFPKALQEHNKWLSDHVEGPNIANVFKRTFYQMMFKFQLGIDPNCAGCVLAIPASVWTSWQRHLGKPDLNLQTDGTYTLVRPREDYAVDQVIEPVAGQDTLIKTPGEAVIDTAVAWIYVFEIDASSEKSPNPIVIDRVIATDAASFSHFALQVSPGAAIQSLRITLPTTLRRRLAAWWGAFSD